MSDYTIQNAPDAKPRFRELWPESAECPLLGFAGWSGSGKTTLLAAVIPLLVNQGLRVALIKHAHHRFDVDHPGKDSHILRKAGASQVLLTSALRFALMHEREREEDPVLSKELARLDQSSADLVLVEGFRDQRFPKLEIFRSDLGRPAMYPRDDAIVAVATDDPAAVHTGVPVLDLNRSEDVAAFILRDVVTADGGRRSLSR